MRVFETSLSFSPHRLLVLSVNVMRNPQLGNHAASAGNPPWRVGVLDDRSSFLHGR